MSTGVFRGSMLEVSCFVLYINVILFSLTFKWKRFPYTRTFPFSITHPQQVDKYSRSEGVLIDKTLLIDVNINYNKVFVDQ